MAAPINRRIGGILDTVWYVGSAPGTLALLLALLALTMVAAAFFPQQPSALQGAVAERWLASTANSYAEIGSFLREIGAFSISGSLWLRILMAALAFNLALRLAIQVATLVQAGRQFRQSSRREWSAILLALGPLLAYAGALVLVAGLFLNSILGWQTGEIALAPGGITSLDRAGGFEFYLEELTGSELSPLARIGLSGSDLEEATEVAEAAPGRPLRLGNLWVALRSAGPALQASAKDSLGRPLLLQSLQPGDAGGLSEGGVSEEVHLLFHQTEAEQEFALPSANLTLRVVSYPSLPERGINVPVFLVEVYEGEESAPALSDFVVDNAILESNGSTLDLRRDRYAIIEVANLPGLIPFLLGWLVLLSGLILALWIRPSPMAKPDAGGLAGDAIARSSDAT